MRAYTRGTAQLVTLPLPDEQATISLTRLSRSADDLLLPYARVRLGRVSADDSAAFAAEIEGAAARHAGDPLAEMAAARAALLRGDTAAVRARLAPMVAASDTSAEARYLLGMSYLEDLGEAESASADAALREARRHFVRAFRIDPNHAPTLFQYASTFAGGPPMADEHINVLARAMELAPQVGAIRFLLAQELMEREEYNAAVAALRPLMYSPHSMRTSRHARRMAGAALRGEQAPADVDDEGDEDGGED